MWVTRDGKLRGVLSEESGHAAGSGGNQEEDMRATVDPEGLLCHPLPWKSCAFASGKEEMSNHEKLS